MANSSRTWLALSLLAVLLVWSGCEDMATEFAHDNPFDPENPGNSGDPYNLSAEIADGGIRLTWDQVNDPRPEGYNLYRKVNNAAFVLNQELGLTGTFTDTEIDNGKRYEYYVIARRGNGEGDPSGVVSVTVNNSPLLVIEGESVTHTPTRNVDLTILAYGAERMILANSSDFAGSTWENYSTTKNWDLSTGVGIKTVYMRVIYSESDTSEVISDAINAQFVENSSIKILSPTEDDTVSSYIVDLILFADYADSVQISNDGDFSSSIWVAMTDTIRNWDIVGTTAPQAPSIPEEIMTVHSGSTQSRNRNRACKQPASQETKSTELDAENENSSDGVFELDAEGQTVFARFKNSFEVPSPPVTDNITVEIRSSVVINGGDVTTPSRFVTITLSSENASQMALSTDSTSLADTPQWQVFSETTTNYELPTGEGIKHVYARFRNESGARSRIYSDDIEPTELSASVIINNSAETTSTRSVLLDLSAIGAFEMQIANGSPPTHNTWESFSAEVLDWELDIGPGNKTVYARLRNNFLIEQTVSDDIEPAELAAMLIIADGADTTLTRTVSLDFSATGAFEMQIANGSPPSGDTWESFSSEVLNWVLDTGQGTKTVYARLRNNFHIEQTICDDIEPAILTPAIAIIPEDSSYINHSDVILSMYNTGALEMKIANGNDSSGVAWQSLQDETDWILTTGDGLKEVTAWFRHDFFEGDAPASDNINVDTQAEISSFGWTTTGGDTIFTGDQVTFTLELADDAFGAETGGEAVVTVTGWNPITLNDLNDGRYRRTITITSDYPRVTNASVTVAFTDRAGNTLLPEIATETITRGLDAGEEQTFSLGNSNETIEMVWIPAGTFMMGAQAGESDRDIDEVPRHEVTISQGFWIGKFEVTQAQWEAVAGYENFYWPGNPNHPAEMVSLDDITNDFLPELGTEWRLPTEAEWEYACRAGVDNEWFWWGSSYYNLRNFAWYSGNSVSQTHNVGQKYPSPWGLYDIHGNVREWCQDWYDSGYYSDCYPSVTDPQGPGTGSDHVQRGGSWYDDAGNCRAANRDGYDSSNRNSQVGFRLVRSGD